VSDGLINWKKLFKDKYVREQKISANFRPRWTPDKEQRQCTSCLSSFTVVKRRHHCRNCGKIFCSLCCDKRMVLDELQYEVPERVCDKCHMKLQNKDQKREQVALGGLKLVVLGPSCGKTVLINRFIMKNFLNPPIPTVGANFLSKTMTSADGKVVKLQIWDTAGSPKFFSTVKNYYVGCAACLLVYDPTDAEALRIPQMWLEKISEESPQLVFALAGTRSDFPESSRKISREAVQSFVDKHGIDVYLETSAKDNYNVEELFQEITESLVVRFDIK